MLSLQSVQCRGREDFPPRSYEAGKVIATQCCKGDLIQCLIHHPFVKMQRSDEARNKHPTLGWALQLQRSTAALFFSPGPTLCTCGTEEKMHSFNTEKPKIICHFVPLSHTFIHSTSTPTNAQSSVITTAINKVFSLEASLINVYSDSGEDDSFLLKTGAIKSPRQGDTASQASRGNSEH